MLRERVAKYADIETRRALGVFDRLPVINFVPRPLPVESWRYWPATRTAIFFHADPNHYEFEVHEGLVFDGEHWTFAEGARVRSTRRRGNGTYSHIDVPPLQGTRFLFAQNPEFIIG
jgi:hypothetical protein